MVVITCQKNSILPRAITTNRCGKGRSKEEVRRQKVDGNAGIAYVKSKRRHIGLSCLLRPILLLLTNSPFSVRNAMSSSLFL